MRILAVDSSSLVASAAIADFGEDEVLRAEYTSNLKKTHSQTLLPMIDEIMRALDADGGSIDAIAVASGPGSFTGLRIGAATVKGLGLVWEKPIIPVPTVDAMAYQFYGAEHLICPIMDARRSQVYTGVYTFQNGTDFEIRMPQCALALADLCEELNRLGERVTFTGDGIPVMKQLIREKMKVPYTFAPAHMNRQRAASVASLGAVLFREGRTVEADAFAPDYLRVSQAERERKEKAEQYEK